MAFHRQGRRRVGFVPVVERSESRLLLSSGGMEGAGMEHFGANVAVKDWYAYYLQKAVKPTTPIYSIVVLNSTGDSLRESVTASSTLVGNFKDGGTIASGEEVLLFTDHVDGKFHLKMNAVYPSTLQANYSFKATKGSKTSVAAGYLFAPAAGWYSTDTALSNTYTVEIEGTGADKKLVIDPPL